MASSDSDSGFIKTIVSAGVHSTMLQVMLMGMYTMIYGGTMYLYIHRNKPNRTIVIVAITLLYMLSGIETIIPWYFNHQVTAAASRGQIALAMVDPSPQWLGIFYVFVLYSVFLVSDSFLIWRCYHVWGMSLRVIAVPFVLLIAETGLLLVSIILRSLYDLRLATLVDGITSALILSSLITTFITTFLIGYRIHTGALMSGSRSKRNLRHVVTMIAESAAVYSFALVGPVITNIVSSTIPSRAQITGLRLFAAAAWYTQVISIVAGVAPTILVARIAIRDTDTEQTFTLTTPHISELEMGSAPIPTGGNDIAQHTDFPGAVDPSLEGAHRDTQAEGGTGMVRHEETDNLKV